jgi:hypothetical protein
MFDRSLRTSRMLAGHLNGRRIETIPDCVMRIARKVLTGWVVEGCCLLLNPYLVLRHL